jgi:hypothetical protein
MATRLKTMKIREVSFVDNPASPGADIILTKRSAPVVSFKEALADTAHSSFIDFYNVEPQLFADIHKAGFNTEEARDERGRWTTAAASLRAGLKSLGSQARDSAKKLVGQAKHIVSNTKLNTVLPVQGGGLHFTFTHGTKSGAVITSHVQIQPQHVKGNKHLENALKAAATVLRAYGRNDQSKIDTGLGGAKFSGSLLLAGASAPNSTTNTGWTGMGGRTAAANVETSHTVVPRVDPLLGKTYQTSGQRAYYTEHGDFVPAAPEHIQRAMEMALTTPPFSPRDKANQMTYREAAGKRSYYTPNRDFVPHTSVERQQTIEAQYAREQARLDAEAAPSQAEVEAHLRAGLPITKLPAGPQTGDSLFWNEAVKKSKPLFSPSMQPFTERERLFGKRSSLFKSNFNDAEARDAHGRWSVGGAAVKEKAKRLLAAIRPSDVAGLLVGGVGAGIYGQAPDEIVRHVGENTRLLVEHVQASPHYQRFAAKVKAKGKALFSKSSALSADDHQELKRHIADGISTMPLHPKVAASDTAIAALVRGAHDTLYRRLCNGQP